MRRRTGILLLLTAGVLLGATLLWVFISSTSLAAVQATLEERTGGVVRAQSVERLWFPPGVLIHELEVESGGLRFHAQELEVRAAWLPLLWGELRAATLRAGGARVDLAPQGSGAAATALPLGADWEINHLDVNATVDGEEKQILHIQHASWTPRLREKSRLELTASATESDASSLRLVGEASAWRPPALPDASVELEFADYPAQPLLGVIAGDSRLLATARLNGKLSITSDAGSARSQGTLRAQVPEGEQLLSLDFQAGATPALITIESATGELAGNRFDASGTVEGWQGSDRQAELTLRLPEARFEDATLKQVQTILGRQTLGFAKDLRGQFAAELKLVESDQRQRVSGRVDLKGLTYSRKGFPALEDLRGRLALSGDRVVFEDVTAKVLDAPARLSGETRGQQVALRLEAERLPVERLPAELGVALPVTNLHGTAHVVVDLSGPADEPVVSGHAALQGVGFDFHQLPVRGIEGQAAFNMAQIDFDDLRGRAGGCDLLVSGRAQAPRWRDTADIEASLPRCPLPALVEAAELAGIGRLPGVEAAALEGEGTVAIGLAHNRWRAELMVPGARWSPAWLGAPLEDVRAAVRVEPEAIEVRNLSGRFGSSPIRLHGRMGLLGTESAPWQLDLEAHLTPQDAESLVPGPWREWVRILSEVEARGHLRGRPEGVTLDAKIETNPTLTASVAPTPVPAAVPGVVEIQARWLDDAFSLDRLAARFGKTELDARGTLQRGPDPQLNFRVQAPPGSSLEELLTLVRLPESLQTLRGKAGVDLALRGPLSQPEWAGAVNLEEVYLPGLLTDPVQLNGRLLLAADGLRLDSLRVVQPSGEFAVNGLLRSEGVSTVEVDGPWANLDRLLGQLPGGSLDWPEQTFLRQHPVQVAIALERAKFLDLNFTDVRGQLEQSDGKLTLSVPRFGLGDGHGRLEGTIEPDGNQLRASLELNQVPVQMLLTDLLQAPPILTGPLDLHIEMTGPVGARREFTDSGHGLARFTITKGRIQKGTLPERLFALAALLREGPFGWGLLSLGKVWNPPNLRKFDTWSGTLELGEGKAQLVESNLVSNTYDLNLQGDLDMRAGTMQMHGEGDFHPPYQFDFSMKSFAEGFGRLFQIVRGRKGHKFEFDVAGELGGTKRIENFRFKD